MNSENLTKLSCQAREMIVEIEKEFKKIQTESNTSNALDYLQKIVDYFTTTYQINK